MEGQGRGVAGTYILCEALFFFKSVLSLPPPFFTRERASYSIYVPMSLCTSSPHGGDTVVAPGHHDTPCELYPHRVRGYSGRMGSIRLDTRDEKATTRSLLLVNRMVTEMRQSNWMSIHLPDYQIWHDRINELLDTWEVQHHHGKAQVQARTSGRTGQVGT